MKPIKILYAGNDFALPKHLANALNGFQIVRTHDEKLSHLFLERCLDYALILADETLPDGAGLSLALYALALARYVHTPVVILSGNVQEVGERVRFVRPDDYQLLSKTIRELTS
jgi:hypothetical protein